MKKLYYLFSVSVGLFLLPSCTTEIEYPTTMGTIQGVVMADTYDDTDHVVVKIWNSNLSKSQITSSDGSFEFTNLPSGNYNLSYTMKGFGTYYMYGFPFLGNVSNPTLLEEIHLAKLPKCTITDVNAEIKVDTIGKNIRKKINYTHNFSVTSEDLVSVYYCLSNVSDVSIFKAKTQGVGYSTGTLDLTSYDTVQFPKGTRVYLKLYPFLDLGPKYFDIQSGSWIYSGIHIDGGSETISLVVN